MDENKWYYKLSNSNEDKTIYCVINQHIKPEKLHEVICLDGYVAEEITKEQYEKEQHD